MLTRFEPVTEGLTPDEVAIVLGLCEELRNAESRGLEGLSLAPERMAVLSVRAAMLDLAAVILANLDVGVGGSIDAQVDAFAAGVRRIATRMAALDEAKAAGVTATLN